MALVFRWDGPPAAIRIAAFCRGLMDRLPATVRSRRPIYWSSITISRDLWAQFLKRLRTQERRACDRRRHSSRFRLYRPRQGPGAIGYGSRHNQISCVPVVGRRSKRISFSYLIASAFSSSSIFSGLNPKISPNT